MCGERPCDRLAVHVWSRQAVRRQAGQKDRRRCRHNDRGQNAAAADRCAGRAGAHCGEVSSKKRSAGHNLRLLYLDGELIDSVRRLPPVVRGDGVLPIGKLIEKENADRLRNGTDAGQTLLTIDAELRGTLRRQGYRVAVGAGGGVES